MPTQTDNGTVWHIRENWPVGSIYIGRKNPNVDLRLIIPDLPLGNPYPVEKYGRDGCIAKFETHTRTTMRISEAYANLVASLYNKDLVCFCAPKACHGDVLLKLAGELHGT